MEAVLNLPGLCKKFIYKNSSLPGEAINTVKEEEGFYLFCTMLGKKDKLYVRYLQRECFPATEQSENSYISSKYR
jgi:hypothetical protein